MRIRIAAAIIGSATIESLWPHTTVSKMSAGLSANSIIIMMARKPRPSRHAAKYRVRPIKRSAISGGVSTITRKPFAVGSINLPIHPESHSRYSDPGG